MAVAKDVQKKVAQQSAGIGAGASLAVIAAWVMGTQGIDVPIEVSAAFGSMIGSIVQEVCALIGAWKQS